MGRGRRLLQGCGLALAAEVILAACSDPVSVYPDIYCRSRITGETVQDKINDVLEECAPMVRVTVEL